MHTHVFVRLEIFMQQIIIENRMYVFIYIVPIITHSDEDLEPKQTTSLEQTIILADVTSFNVFSIFSTEQF